MSLVNQKDFAKCVAQYQGDARIKHFSCWHQFLCMSFGQLSHWEGLRDLVLCLQAQSPRLYHVGISSGVKKSTLSDANESRDWRIYADFALVLVQKARHLYRDRNDTGIELKNVVYALDSTTIELCLDVFWWARFRKHKAAVKLHTLLDSGIKKEIERELLTNLKNQYSLDDIFISAANKEGIEQLREMMVAMVKREYQVRYPHEVRNW